MPLHMMLARAARPLRVILDAACLRADAARLMLLIGFTAIQRCCAICCCAVCLLFALRHVDVLRALPARFSKDAFAMLYDAAAFSLLARRAWRRRYA